MHIHILGICGTFMGGIARLAQELGHEVSGSDMNIYPPMSTQLADLGIELKQGYLAQHLQPAPDLVIVGNALSRGNECVEYMLDNGLDYLSGPQWLSESILKGRHVLAVAGTHGKTTTTSILAWLLEAAGLHPGFLIGGVAENFGCSARLGDSGHFVVEADEYDTAFFDKRSKFVHYRPRTLIINNIEYDHADIFADIGAIRREFHHLVRTIPGTGEIVFAAADEEIQQVLAMGCWTPAVSFGMGTGQWQVEPLRADFSSFKVQQAGRAIATVTWSLMGRHNALNALAAIVAAGHVGIRADDACRSLTRFKNVKRRLERLACVKGVTIYDDFAHHPTAIQATLEALRGRVGGERIIAILEPRSNTMKMGVHDRTLAPSLAGSDLVWLFQPPGLSWELGSISKEIGHNCQVFTDVNDIISAAAATVQQGDHLLIMSNGAFENLHQRLIRRLEAETDDPR